MNHKPYLFQGDGINGCCLSFTTNQYWMLNIVLGFKESCGLSQQLDDDQLNPKFYLGSQKLLWILWTQVKHTIYNCNIHMHIYIYIYIHIILYIYIWYHIYTPSSRVAYWATTVFFFCRSKGESRQHEDLGLFKMTVLDCYPNRRSIIWGIYREYVFFFKSSLSRSKKMVGGQVVNNGPEAW